VSAAAQGQGRRPAQAALWRPTPLWALELADLPTELHFIRDHFPTPTLEPGSWMMSIQGSRGSAQLDLDQLRALPSRTLSVVLECAGHRRQEFSPLPGGLPWSCGAVGEARWTGASLRTVLALAGVPPDAVEVVLEGADAGPVDGFTGEHHFARSLPLAKALEHDVLLAYEMNGEPIAVERGGPVRAVVPGWYATDSVKWVDCVWFTRETFDGVFQAHDYRLLAPGEEGPGERMTELPVNALISTPHENHEGLPAGNVVVRGVAWGGSGGVARVEVQLDDRPWMPARVARSEGRYRCVRWELSCQAGAGEHELRSRAIDGAGHRQPDLPRPNVRGYANNAVHRVRFRAT
jgi:DMSO/TMAO reductase YedYZ molybdopterin-dependent catalytic subunit